MNRLFRSLASRQRESGPQAIQRRMTTEMVSELSIGAMELVNPTQRQAILSHAQREIQAHGQALRTLRIDSSHFSPSSVRDDTIATQSLLTMLNACSGPLQLVFSGDAQMSIASFPFGAPPRAPLRRAPLRRLGVVRQNAQLLAIQGRAPEANGANHAVSRIKNKFGMKIYTF